jgi:uncharacterized protein
LYTPEEECVISGVPAARRLCTPEEECVMSVESNKETLRRGYEAFNRQDIPAATRDFDEHIAWTEPEWTYGQVPEGTIYGRDEVLRQIFQPVGEYYDVFEVYPLHYYGEGDVVVAEGSFRLRPKGVSELLEVPFTHVWQFRDGRAVGMRAFIDVAQLYHREELRRAA